MYVVNADEKQLATFVPLVQKYLIHTAKLPVYKKIGSNSYFRQTKRLDKELAEAPLWVKILAVNYKGGQMDG